MSHKPFLFIVFFLYLASLARALPLSAQEAFGLADFELHYIDYSPKTPWREQLRTERRKAIYIGNGRFVFFFRKPAEWLRSVRLVRPGLSEIVANYLDHDALLGLVLASVDAEAQRRLHRMGFRSASFSHRRLEDYAQGRFFVDFPGRSGGGIAESASRILVQRGFVPRIVFHTVSDGVPDGAIVWDGKTILGFAANFEKRHRSFLATPTSLVLDFIQRAGKKRQRAIRRWPLRYQSGLRTGLSLPGFRYHTVVGRKTRSFYGLKETENAVFVDSVSPFLFHRTELRKGDLILSVDGKKLLEDGSLQDPVLGIVPLGSYLAFYRGRPTLPQKVFRLLVKRAHLRREIRHRLLPLENQGFLVPDYLRQPAFFVIGGIVLQELSGYYLSQHRDAPSELKKVYGESNILDPRGLRRIVVADRILPLKINVGYSARHVRLLSVDGVVVRDLAHARRLAGKAAKQKRDLVLGLDDGRRLVLDSSQLPAANRELQNKYGIPFLERAFGN